MSDAGDIEPLEPLDPGARQVLEIGKARNAPPFDAGTPDEARRAYNASFPAVQGERETVASLDDREIDGPRGPVTVRIYRGVDAPAHHGAGLLYLHGGGWLVGNLDSHDDICRSLANLARCRVISVDYRLAPEHKFPAGLEDCAAALAFAVASAADLGLDPHRIAVAGDSAGGNLAAGLALLARSGHVPPVAAQLLFYPCTDAAQSHDSYRRFSEGYGLTAATMRWFRDHYMRDSTDIADERVSPLRAESLAGLAPAFVAIAAQDILADEGIAYANRLIDAGVRVILRTWPDQIHGFVSMGRYIPAARQAIEAAVASWREFEAATV